MITRLTVAVLIVLAGSTARAGSDDDELAHAREMLDWGTELFLLSELLEIQPNNDGIPIQYDLLGWFGGASDRLWMKAEGQQEMSSTDGETELQLLYGRLITPFWDVQVGARLDVRYGDRPTEMRALLVVGLQGLAPGWFEVEPAMFVSHRGDVSFNVVGSYDTFITQRLVAQWRFETTIAIQDVEEFGIGSGFTDVEFGLRIRYEILRELAPYVGISWRRLLMETEDLARAAGEDVSRPSFVAGFRLWY